MLFALPDVLDEEKGPYADFLNHVSEKRVSMLNELIEFAEPFSLGRNGGSFSGKTE